MSTSDPPPLVPPFSMSYSTFGPQESDSSTLCSTISLGEDSLADGSSFRDAFTTEVPAVIQLSEAAPLLLRTPTTSSAPSRRSRSNSNQRTPNPWWLVPFFLVASITRGMTLAPRVEVFTNLACEALQPIRSTHSSVSLAQGANTTTAYGVLDYVSEATTSLPTIYESSSSSILIGYKIALENKGDSEDRLEVNSQLPKKQHCFTDPKVRQYAAELQTMATLTVGILTAITTGWWGTLGDRVGRTKIMAFSQIGCLFTDFVLLIVSRNSQALVPFGGHRLIMVGPVVEGLLGGWSTLLSAVNAYVSDTTAHGSRSDVYSRFQGLMFVGVAVGPALGGSLIKSHQMDIFIVFIVAVLISLANAAFATFFLPESLTEEVRGELVAKRMTMEGSNFDCEEVQAGWSEKILKNLSAVLSPLALFLPNGQDWRLTYVGAGYFSFMLTIGLYPMKLMYAEHFFNWNSVDLGRYLTFIGSVRAAYLLLILPFLIRTFKPKPKPNTPAVSVSKHHSSIPPTPSKANLTSDIRFDLQIARLSMTVDALGYTLVSLTNVPEAFVLATGLSSFGSGTAAAIQSLCLCLLPNPREDTGKMFGAISIIHTVSATVVSPLVFGLLYAYTVQVFPKAIFVTGAGALFIAVILLLLVQPRRRKIQRRIPERGRPRHSKALWGSPMPSPSPA